jgi:hypothetical protein
MAEMGGDTAAASSCHPAVIGDSGKGHAPLLPQAPKGQRVEFEDESEIDTQMKQPSHETRVEQLLGAPLDDAVRRWPQSGEILRGKARIAEVESHFQGLKLAVTRPTRAGTSSWWNGTAITGTAAFIGT